MGAGHGIGLPLVQRLVREMGADIEIDSAPGKGTAVLIAFGGFTRSIRVNRIAMIAGSAFRSS